MCGFVYCADCDVIHSLDLEREFVGNGRKCFVRNGSVYGDARDKSVGELDRERRVLQRGTGVWRGRLRER